MSGWIKLHRKALDSAVWQDQDVWRLWTWMLLEASHKNRQHIVRKVPVTVSAGQLVFSRSIAAEATGLTERTIRTCLDALVTLGNVTIETTNRFSVVTITKWATYQLSENENDQQDDKLATNRRPTGDQPFLRNKNEKNEKNSPAPAQADFDAFWKAYPKKKAKGAALSAWNKLNGSRPPLETLLSAIAAQRAGHDWQKDGGQFIPFPATWLNQRRWDDEAGPIETVSTPDTPRSYTDEEYEAMMAKAKAQPRPAPEPRYVPEKPWKPGMAQA